MAAVVGSLRRAVEVLVVDLPRATVSLGGPGEGAAPALQACDVVVLVVPAQLRAAAAAARVVGAVAAEVADVRLVVRGPAPGDLRAEHVAAAVGLPLTADLPAEPGLAASLERGIVPGRSRRSPLGRLARALLDDVVPRAAG
jgi:uncharacterized protein YjlB